MSKIIKQKIMRAWYNDALIEVTMESGNTFGGMVSNPFSNKLGKNAVLLTTYDSDGIVKHHRHLPYQEITDIRFVDRQMEDGGPYHDPTNDCTTDNSHRGMRAIEVGHEKFMLVCAECGDGIRWAEGLPAIRVAIKAVNDRKEWWYTANHFMDSIGRQRATVLRRPGGVIVAESLYADLIAAAPQMRDELEILEKGIDEDRLHNQDAETVCLKLDIAYCDRIKAVILKARGE